MCHVLSVCRAVGDDEGKASRAESISMTSDLTGDAVPGAMTGHVGSEKDAVR